MSNITNNITIVSGFFTLNNNNNRNINQYMEYGNKLLSIKLPKIIFMEKNIYESFFIEKNYENTKFILIEKKDLYLYNEYNKISKFDIIGNKDKDTIDYMFIMCNKTEWIKNAIELNLFNTTQFIWIDFGIYHVFNNMSIFEKSIYDLNNKKYNNIRIAGCWDVNINYNIDIYRNIAWYFAGGVFGGDKDKLLEFAKLMKEKCLQIINERNSIMWEVNIWYLIYKENSNLFDWYKSDHNITILENY